MAAWPRGPAQGLADLLGAGVFGEVAAGAGAQCVDDGPVIGVGGEHEHFDAGSCSRRRRVASTPSQRGMRRSISTTSGCSLIARASASSPSAAAPTTSMP